ncbi:MAG TPA: PepSY domain-containing protein [Gammaproteobacteria bacterium]|jgi:uncharacterized membrane protein YkoI|nr:PepSY domain-containing protein [Gammaproteobacteria bacterium]
MKYLSRMVILVAVAGMAAFTPARAKSYPGQLRYGAQASISLQQAERIALKAFSGQIISKELEKERGGSGLRYSFDIRRGKVVHEVGVDAKTGEVLENSIDNDSD